MEKYLDELLIAVIGAIAGGLILYFFQVARDRWQERGKLFTSSWIQVIYRTDNRTIVEKVDVVESRQLGETVHADIRGKKPRRRQKSQWSFTGRYREGVLFGHFWSKDLANPSLGTIFIRQTDVNCFSGYYHRRIWKEHAQDTDTFVILQVPLDWYRQPDRRSAEAKLESVEVGKALPPDF